MKKQAFVKRLTQIKTKIQTAKAEVEQTIKQAEALNYEIATWKEELAKRLSEKAK